MSGFPVLNSPTDLYTQITFLGRTLIPFASYHAFRNFYSILRQIDRRITIEVGHKNLDHLAKIIEPFSVRILKKDCLDLPDKIYEQRYVEMTIEQAQLYRSMKQQAFAELSQNQSVIAVNLITQLGKLHQIANGILLGGIASRSIETEKDKVLLEILSEESTGPVAIAANYTLNVENLWALIKSKFGPASCGIIYGATGDVQRDKYITLFQQGKLPYLVFNPATVREGIDLFISHTCIFYNNSFKLDYRLQFEDRFHRIGQTNKVTYLDLITENTIEERLLKILQEKRNIGGLIFNESEWTEWFK
jgi:SNF2 family DNA or RNA helicase